MNYDTQAGRDLALDYLRLQGELAACQGELCKWQTPHPDSDLEEMRQQAQDSHSIAAHRAYISALRHALAHSQLEVVGAKTREQAAQAQTRFDTSVIETIFGFPVVYVSSENEMPIDQIKLGGPLIDTTLASEPQPAPTGKGKVVADYIHRDIDARVACGIEHYGTPLRTHNERDALVDAYQELIDLLFYLRQAILEREEQQ